MTANPPRRRIAVVGAGWAGLAAAVAARQAGHAVTVYEMAPHSGGRARQLRGADGGLDNGQHILIGAYTQTLGLLREIGIDPDLAFVRTPLALRYPDGRGLVLGAGAPHRAFAAAVARRAGWRWRDRAALLVAAAGWQLRGHTCPAEWTVAELTRGLPAAVRADLIDPLCVAALNTASAEACARTFLRVLRDALAVAGGTDLLLPRAGLSTLLPTPAADWLRRHGATLHTRRRVQAVDATPGGWRVDDTPFDAVVLATSAAEAARLARPAAPAWADAADALAWEPIVTVWLRGKTLRLAQPMLMLPADATRRPAQFVFDHGQLTDEAGLLAFVVSGARDWVARGHDAIAAAVRAQALEQGLWPADAAVELVQVVSERRATFRCSPALRRPAPAVATQLLAAGDYVAGPYPATLEGAVRSGKAAVRALG